MTLLKLTTRTLLLSAIAIIPMSAIPAPSPYDLEVMGQMGLDCNMRHDGCNSNTTTQRAPREV